MTPKELHEACHEACMQCPQFRGYDDDTIVDHRGTQFGDIPKRGMYAVYQFWKDDDLLWRGGYCEELPPEARRIFKEIEGVIKKAIQEHFQ